MLVVTRFHSTSLEDWVIIEKITPPSLFVDEVEQGLLIHAPNWRAVKNILSPLNPPPMHFTVFDQQVVNGIFRETFQYPSIISGVRRYATFQIRAIVESLFSTCRNRVHFVIHQTAFIILETIIKHAYRFDLYRRNTHGQGIDYVVDSLDEHVCIRFTAFENDELTKKYMN